jgi:16S rRNA (adenine1518-N6/adenine1519-N6)-dimethyltransferase
LLPKKSLGQHFLHDPNVVRKILAVIDAGQDDVMLEIGPGQGALTRGLAKSVRTLVAVEIDPRAVERLRGELSGSVQILHQDVLELDLRRVASDTGAHHGLRIVGNIPYYITTPILFMVLDQRDVVRDATLMMQREVARRLVAAPGTKDYGILSVFCRVFADVRVLFDVSPNAFVPRPAVMSSVVHLSPFVQPRVPMSDEAFFRYMVRFVFGQRRKMLRHTLSELAKERRLTLPAAFALRERPQDLTGEELVDLANRLHAALGREHPA